MYVFKLFIVSRQRSTKE